jgi:tetratricopeptide (TPR) repeat protein
LIDEDKLRWYNGNVIFEIGDKEMAYSKEEKMDILAQMKNKSIREISEETGISKQTLYNWRNQANAQDITVPKTLTKPKIKEDIKNYTGEKEDFDFKEGRSLYKQKKYNEAIEYFKNSVKNQGSDFKRSIFFVGKIYAIKCNNKKAEVQLKKYIEIDKDENPHARLELGRLYSKQRKYDEAEAQFKKYIDIDKDKTPHARLELGILYSKQKRYEEAEKQYKKCIEIDKDKSPHARLELGILYSKQEKYDEAEAQFKKYIDIDKDENPHARLELGRLYSKQERYDEAEEQFEKCKEIGKDKSPHARLELGILYSKQERYDEAEAQFKKYIEIDKDKTPHARLELARLYSKQKRDDEADEELKIAIDLDKDNFIKLNFPELIEKHMMLQVQKQNIFKIVDRNDKDDIKDVLIPIRAKIWAGTLEKSDLDNMDQIRENITEEQYYLIKMAMYEKLGQKKNALELIKQIEKEGIKTKNLSAIKDRLKSKKRTIFDLDKWDSLIGWEVAITEQYNIEEMKSKEKNANLYAKPIETKTSEIDGEKLGAKEPSNKVISEKTKKVQSSIITNIGTITRQISPTPKTSNQKKKSKIKETTNKVTIETTMSSQLKDTIKKINVDYYVKMQPSKQVTNASIEAQKKYIKKYDKLQSILGCSTDNKRAQMELMLVLINEGYKDIAKQEFPEQDYNFINDIINQYNTKKLLPSNGKQKIDEYCIE